MQAYFEDLLRAYPVYPEDTVQLAGSFIMLDDVSLCFWIAKCLRNFENEQLSTEFRLLNTF